MGNRDVAQRYLTPGNYRKQVNQSLKGLTKDGWFLPLYSKQVESDAMDVKFEPGVSALSEHRPH